jgi:organic radical activating enzyme
VLTGGEPALQLDQDLLGAMHDAGFLVALETNGTVDNAALAAVDWLTVSPKLGSTLAVRQAHELKVVVPGVVAADNRPLRVGRIDIGAGGWSVEALEDLATSGAWRALLVSPQDGPERAAHMRWAASFVLDHPAWRLSVQTHKVAGLR